MKIILKTAVDKLGAFGDTVNVARGYARNYLIPRGIAMEATPGNLRQFEAEKEAWLKKEAAKKEKAEALAAEISGISLTFTRKVSEEGKLFGSVTVHDIADGLKAQGQEVERKAVGLDEPIKTLGEFTVPVKLHGEVAADVSVAVVKEEEAE